MKKVKEFLSDRVLDIPTSLIGLVIIALSLNEFLQEKQNIKETIEHIIVGAGFILTPRTARDIFFGRFEKFKEETNSD